MYINYAGKNKIKNKDTDLSFKFDSFTSIHIFFGALFLVIFYFSNLYKANNNLEPIIIFEENNQYFIVEDINKQLKKAIKENNGLIDWKIKEKLINNRTKTFIKDIKIIKSFNSKKTYISITTKKPYAISLQNEYLFYLDIEGNVINNMIDNNEDAKAFNEKLIFLFGSYNQTQIKSFFKFINLYYPNSNMKNNTDITTDNNLGIIKKAEFLNESNRWNIYTSNGYFIKLPTKNFMDVFGSLIEIIKENPDFFQNHKYIDMRFYSEKIIVKKDNITSQR